MIASVPRTSRIIIDVGATLEQHVALNGYIDNHLLYMYGNVTHGIKTDLVNSMANNHYHDHYQSSFINILNLCKITGVVCSY